MELATAVREFLEFEILPTLDDHRLRFRTLVAMNALSIVEREGPAPVEADWETARRIRAGDIRDDDLSTLKAEVAEKLAIASPNVPRALRMSRAARRRIFLMRHGAVAYFDDSGRPVPPDTVRLTEEGRRQAEAARDLLAGIVLDRVIASGLPRTMETAAIVAAGREAEAWPELREIRGERLSSIPAGELEEAFVHAFRGVVPNDKRFLGGETIGELFDRVLPALDRLLADDRWDTSLLVLHGAVNRAVLSSCPHRGAAVPRPLRAGARVPQRPRRRRRVGRSRGQRRRDRPGPRLHPPDDDGELLGAVPRQRDERGSLRAGPKADPLTRSGLRLLPAQTSALLHLSADTGLERAVRELHDLLAVDRELGCRPGLLQVARKQERVGLGPAPARPS